MVVDDGGPNLSLISNPQQTRPELAAVLVSANPTLASSSSKPMVRITDVEVPQTG